MFYYDGYEKEKAYLLDYGEGNHYKDAILLKIVMSAKNTVDNKMVVKNNTLSGDRIE